jgi:hypothetical protein
MQCVDCTLGAVPLARFENSGSSPPVWTRRNITTAGAGVRAVHVGDLDGDGDPDVLSANYDTGTIAWWVPAVRSFAWPARATFPPMPCEAA